MIDSGTALVYSFTGGGLLTALVLDVGSILLLPLTFLCCIPARSTIHLLGIIKEYVLVVSSGVLVDILLSELLKRDMRSFHGIAAYGAIRVGGYFQNTRLFLFFAILNIISGNMSAVGSLLRAMFVYKLVMGSTNENTPLNHRLFWLLSFSNLVVWIYLFTFQEAYVEGVLTEAASRVLPN